MSHTLKEVKKALKLALPASNKIDNIWSVEGHFYGYQIKGFEYSNLCKIVDGFVILLN